MAAKSYVAVSHVRHGKEDGTLVTFDRGDDVKGLDKDTMVHLYGAGAIAVKGSPEDPNTWEDGDDGYRETTPAQVVEVLKAQVGEADGPGDVTSRTQFHDEDEPPKDPAALLRGTADKDASPENEDQGE